MTILQYTNISAYKFISLEKIATLRVDLRKQAVELDIKGTILLSHEGINVSLSGAAENIQAYQEFLKRDSRFSDIEFKQSFSDFIPFSKMIIKLKKEIVTMGVDGVQPPTIPKNTISPRELKQWYDQGTDFTILDTRNVYETKIGTFENAKLLPLDNFRQFPNMMQDMMHSMSDADKDKPIVMFCTGGVRCEKAMPLLQNIGFKKIYQLHGGILKYFEECGGAHYSGECFVFDDRVAVDPDFRVTGAQLCDSCQTPVTVTEQVEAHFAETHKCLNCLANA